MSEFHVIYTCQTHGCMTQKHIEYKITHIIQEKIHLCTLQHCLLFMEKKTKYFSPFTFLCTGAWKLTWPFAALMINATYIYKMQHKYIARLIKSNIIIMLHLNIDKYWTVAECLVRTANLWHIF